jgi:peroxiredoxin Q/BCP
MSERLAALSIVAAFAIAFVAVAAEAPAEDASTKVKVGDTAPDFEIFAATGGQQAADAPKKLSDLKGEKNVLLAFYPKADTPGCTKQLCGYRDDIEKFKSASTEVIAISVDHQTDSDAFKDKFSLPFPVLGDPEKKVIEAYGVPLREFQGNQFAERSVFLVDKEGIVRYIDMKYDLTKDKTSLYDAIVKLEQPAEEKKDG